MFLSRSLVILVATLGFIRPLMAEKTDSQSLLFSSEIESTASYHFTGNNPPLDAAMLARLRADAQKNAEDTCRSLMGPYTLLAKTNESPIGQSILTYFLQTTYLCGRQVESTSEVVPYLINSLSYKDGALTEIASDLILKAGKNAIPSVVDLVHAQDGTEELKIAGVKILGRFLQSGADGLTFYLLDTLGSIINYGSEMLAYHAQEAYGKYYGAAYYAKLHRRDFNDRGYAKVIYGISQNFKLGSSYEVEIGELKSLLQSDDNFVVSYAISAIDVRKLRDAEFEEILPLLSTYADSQSPRRQDYVFRILSTRKTDAVATVIVKATDASLLTGKLSDSNYLFQVLLALKEVSDLSASKAALPALREIAKSTINPDNHYVQNMAALILAKMGG